MTTPFLGLRTTIYKVSDLKAATAWYTKAFQAEPYFNEVFYVGFSIAGYELGLIPDETSSTAKVDTVHTYWGVTHVEKEYQLLLELGATEFEAPHNVGGEIVVAAVKDPWNNVIGIIFNPEFKLPHL